MLMRSEWWAAVVGMESVAVCGEAWGSRNAAGGSSGSCLGCSTATNDCQNGFSATTKIGKERRRESVA